jgi:hypothetical protein
MCLYSSENSVRTELHHDLSLGAQRTFGASFLVGWMVY